MSRRVLVADDEPAMRLLLRLTLEQHGLDVEEAADGDEALDRIARGRWGVVVLDHRMPGMTGLEVARDLRARGDRVPIVLYSGYLEDAVRAEAAQLGLQTVDKSEPEHLTSVVLQHTGGT
jgi:CheY-like chemotaxis protein